MRYFARLLRELQSVVETTTVGQVLQPPSLLSQMEVDRRRLTYMQMGLDSGGPPVVLLHGFGGFFMDWPRLMAPLAKQYHLYALDLPGWGFSEVNPRSFTRGMEADAHVVHEFIHKLGLKKVILAGISYGAGVCWAAGALHVPHVERLLLLNPMPPWPLRYMNSLLYRSIFLLNRHPLTGHFGHQMMSKTNFKIICRESLRHLRLLDSFYLDLAYRVIKQPHVAKIIHAHALGAKKLDWSIWENKLGEIKIPTLIMQGENDRIFSMESARYLQSLIPNCEVKQVADCGHAMVFDQHRAVVTQLEEWRKL